ELSGHAALGHAERVARYAAAIAVELGFDAAAVDRIATAGRLHHLGAVSVGGPGSMIDVSGHGAAILRQAGFLDDVADLLDAVGGRADDDRYDAEASVVRVASDFDDIVGEQPG